MISCSLVSQSPPAASAASLWRCVQHPCAHSWARASGRSSSPIFVCAIVLLCPCALLAARLRAQAVKHARRSTSDAHLSTAVAFSLSTFLILSSQSSRFLAPSPLYCTVCLPVLQDNCPRTLVLTVPPSSAVYALACRVVLSCSFEIRCGDYPIDMFLLLISSKLATRSTWLLYRKQNPLNPLCASSDESVSVVFLSLSLCSACACTVCLPIQLAAFAEAFQYGPWPPSDRATADHCARPASPAPTSFVDADL